MSQIIAIATLSKECEQHIQVGSFNWNLMAPKMSTDSKTETRYNIDSVTSNNTYLNVVEIFNKL